MHPALSIIVFTTATGFGYGLAALLGLGVLDPATQSAKVAHLLAFALIAGGLLSSTLHLGNPKRAWRALSQWRTSWLSREGVLAIATFLPLACITLATLFSDRYIPLPGILVALLSAATVYSTSMLYASLRSVDAWHTPLTSACYLLFAASGGLTLASLFAAMGGGVNFRPLAGASIAALTLAFAAKLAWRKRMLTLRPRSTPETATGLGFIGRVRLFESPHTNGNYLTREMGFRVARKHARKLAMISLLVGGVAPMLLLLLGAMLAPPGAFRVSLAAHAVLFHAIGVAIERWLFFAEARHAVMNYYDG